MRGGVWSWIFSGSFFFFLSFPFLFFSVFVYRVLLGTGLSIDLIEGPHGGKRVKWACVVLLRKCVQAFR